MRIPSVPGPRDLMTLLDRGGEAVEQLLAVVPRMRGLLDAAEELVADAQRVRADADRVRADADRVRADAEELVARIEGTRRSAEELVSRVAVPVERVSLLLDAVEPQLLKLQPVLDRLAETTDPREVDAMVGLIDHLPLLVARLEGEVFPMLGTLRSVAPDVHDLLVISRELNELLSHLPGMGRIKKRVDEEQAGNGQQG